MKEKKDLRNLAIAIIILFCILSVCFVAVFKSLYKSKQFYLPDIDTYVKLDRNYDDSIGTLYISKDDIFENDYIKFQCPHFEGYYIHYLPPDKLYAINLDSTILEIKSSNFKIAKIDYLFDSKKDIQVNDSDWYLQPYLREMKDSVFINKPHYLFYVDGDFKGMVLFYSDEGGNKGEVLQIM